MAILLDYYHLRRLHNEVLQVSHNLKYSKLSDLSDLAFKIITNVIAPASFHIYSIICEIFSSLDLYLHVHSVQCGTH